jgi:2',3'-cyclic-nucleotide 2'-phosphodiesterase (5'-nucleotidase family)
VDVVRPCPHPVRRLAIALACLGALTSPVSAATPPARKEVRIAILSTSDVKGKTSPCGCTIPKGGLSRLASFADSLRAEYHHVLLVDTGGYFPEEARREPVVPFLMNAMKLLAFDAVGVGDRDLGFGLAFLRENAARAGIPVVSANLAGKPGGALVFPASTLVQRDDVKIGFFSLVADQADFGRARDSIVVLDPTAAAKQAVADLRRQGAQVVVLLSNLGRTGTEDLCTAVDGIDVAIAAHEVPLLEKGRLIRNTVVVYGGEQGQNAGRTAITLDPARRIEAVSANVVVMGPSYPDAPAVLAMVRAFEDKLTETLHRSEPGAAPAPVHAH